MPFTNLHAIMVSVDYTDLLRITLPINRHHFQSVTIVTSYADHKNIYLLAKEHDAYVYPTNAFYDDRADFNKWKALEEALTAMDMRNIGWICLMDADVVWPRNIEYKLADPKETYATKPLYSNYLRVGYLYSPLRHMYPTIPTNPSLLPPENEWARYPIHRNVNEWAGYSQIFHTSDSNIQILNRLKQPWHSTSWKHAGGADSFFQAMWHPSLKIRPNFNVLHLGEAGANWCGRVTPYADGSVPSNSVQRSTTLMEYMRKRREHRSTLDPFKSERIP